MFGRRTQATRRPRGRWHPVHHTYTLMTQGYHRGGALYKAYEPFCQDCKRSLGRPQIKESDAEKIADAHQAESEEIPSRTQW